MLIISMYQFVEYYWNTKQSLIQSDLFPYHNTNIITNPNAFLSIVSTGNTMYASRYLVQQEIHRSIIIVMNGQIQNSIITRFSIGHRKATVAHLHRISVVHEHLQNT